MMGRRAPLPAQGQSDTEMPGEGEGKRQVSPGHTLGPALQQQLLPAFPAHAAAAGLTRER